MGAMTAMDGGNDENAGAVFGPWRPPFGQPSAVQNGCPAVLSLEMLVVAERLGSALRCADRTGKIRLILRLTLRAASPSQFVPDKLVDPAGSSPVRGIPRQFLTGTKKPQLVGLFLNMADRTGLEPATSGVTGRHSNQLNYRSALSWQGNALNEVVGGTGVEPVTYAL